jgi:hypothetical protein
MKLSQSGLLALVVASFTVSAQDLAGDELEPAVSTETLEQMDSGPGPQAAADDLAEIDPAVPTAVLAADVRRRSRSSGGVMDELDLGRTEITGNQELPKVLYIVPWQKSDPGDLTGKPVNTLLDEVLAPVDRTEFLRQVGYYDDLYGETE